MAAGMVGVGVAVLVINIDVLVKEVVEDAVVELELEVVLYVDVSW
jgi:hypothetical protein